MFLLILIIIAGVLLILGEIIENKTYGEPFKDTYVKELRKYRRYKNRKKLI